MKRYVLSLLLLVPFLMASQCANAPGRYQLFMPPVGSPFLRPSEEDNPVQFLHRLDTATGRIQLFKFEAEFTKAVPYVEGPKTKACLEKLENAPSPPGRLRTPEEVMAPINACKALDSTGGEPSRPTGRYVMVEVPVVETE